ncbi:MAG: hypothetical protein HUK15_03240, partial [Bacteroidales bacterium]|nr:hypothetical protein [Bacteroidales bacterium]
EASGFLSYYWSNGSSNSTFTTPVEYTFWVRAFDGICYYYDTITTHKYPETQIILDDNAYFCENSSVVVEAPNGFQSYQWSNGTTGRTTTVNTSGYLSVVALDQNSCSSKDSVYVNEVQNPQVFLGNDTTYCTDGNVLISPVLADEADYLWSTGETANSIAISTSGTYWLKLTNEYGCTNSDTINISVIAVPPIGLPDAISFCEDFATVSPANSFVSYEWSTGETTPSLEIWSSGVYTLTVTDVTGCTISDEVNATKLELVQPFLGNDTVFCGMTERRLYLNSSYASYLWNDSTTNPYIDVLTEGTYSVTVTGSNGCTAETSINATFTEVYPEITSIT